MAEEMADLFLSGAMTMTLPKFDAAWQRASKPGAKMPSSLVKSIIFSDMAITVSHAGQACRDAS
jgi:hypothetical protein